MIWIIICYALLLGYIFLIAYYRRHWLSLPLFQPSSKPSTMVSVIVPARNEAGKIEQCLDSLLSQDYPSALLDIIVIDDHSTDETAAIVSRYAVHSVRLVRLQEEKDLHSGIMAFKKMAITAGLRVARGQLIVTTDADCQSGNQWIRHMEALYREKRPVFIAGPVRMIPGKSFLSKFQSLDFAILQGITAASVHSGFHPMCNGANMAYKKNVFVEVGGYEGDRLASGDDMMLLYKILDRYPRQIQYLNAGPAIVDTLPAPDWTAFFSQRMRWASKTGRYGDTVISWVWAGVYALNFSFTIAFIYACYKPFYFTYLVLLVLLKTAIEWRFVKDILNFYQLRSLMKWFLPSQPVHILYIVITGILGRFWSYEWKGRSLK